MRYHVLKVEKTLTKIAACLGFVVGSYLASCFVNASPITHPALSGPRSRGVIVTTPPLRREHPAELPDVPDNVELNDSRVHKL